MHHFVQRIMRGVIFCTVSIAITACAGFNDRTERTYAAASGPESENDLSRIDAIRLRLARKTAKNNDYNTAIRFFESVRQSSLSHPAPLVGIAGVQGEASWPIVRF